MLSTHILAHAQELCDRVIIINSGRIVAEDTPERLSAQIAGGGRITLLVDGDGDGLPAALSALPGITQVRALAENRFEIETAPGTDGRAKIAETVVKGGWPLLEIHRDRATLEQIFIELTKEDQEEAEDTAAEKDGK